MRRYFRKLFGTQATARHAVHQALARTRLGVTALEDRLTPADLIPVGLGAPSVIAAGETIPATMVVFNAGTTTGGTWNDRVQLSTDPLASADDVTFGTATFSGGLPMNGMYPATVVGTVPAGTPNGIRFLVGTTDALNQLPETNEANNSRPMPVAVVPSAIVGPVRTIANQLQSALGAAVVPTSTTANSVTFGLNASSTYRIGAFTLTNLQATVTVSAAGVVSLAGTANLQVPTGGGTTAVVPITFSGNSTSFTVSGAANLPSLQLGADPQVIATNATVQVSLTVQLATSTVTGSAQVSAASVSLRSGGATMLTALNFQASINPAGQLLASATTVSILGGRATAAGVSFNYDYAAGRLTGAVALVTGAIGPIQMSAANASLVLDPGSGEPLLSVASASMSVPMNGGVANLTATGFRLTPTGRFQFDSLALTIPGQTAGGVEITGSFAGEVRLSGTTVFVDLTGTAQVFNTNVTVGGTLTASASGLFGALTVRTTGGSTALVLGQSLGFTYSGTATLMVNTTTVARTITAAGETRTIAANSGRLVAEGSLSAGGFTLTGVIDIAASANGSAQVFASADLSLGQFGLVRTTGVGSFRVVNGGLVGSLNATQVTFPAGGFSLNGALSFRLNTTAGAVDGIAPGALVRAASGITAGGYTFGGAAEVGFRNNTGTANDYYYAALSGSVSVYGGAVTVSVAGEVRSNGFVSLSGTTTFTLAESQTGGTGLSMSGTLAVTLTRGAGSTGAIVVGASFDGTIRWLGLDVLGASATIDSTGLVRVTGEVFGIGILSWEFDL